MPKATVSIERKAGSVLAVLGLALTGLVVAARVSDTRHPDAPADERAIATAVSASDPTPPASIFPGVGAPQHIPTHPTMVSQSSGDPVLSHGFGGLHTSSPVRYANLTVFPIYRTTPAGPGPAVTTLDAGMGNRIVSVVEPSLTVTNVGPQPAYVPGGTVVPGGDQDQGVAQDAVLPARSGAVIVASYCVEEGRSMGPSPSFHGDVAMAIPSVRYAMQTGSQEAVWAAVASATGHFGAHSDTGAYHALDLSAAARAASLPYVTALTGSASLDKAVGAVVAINGKIVCADVYRDPALFAQLWPALLRSYALQAAMVPAGGQSAVPQSKADRWLVSLDAAPGAQGDGAPGAETAQVGTLSGIGTRTAVTVGGKALFHEAFWTSDAALTNRA